MAIGIYKTHPPLGGTPTAHGLWEPLHGGQGSISLVYQTYTSAHLFDTLVSGMGQGGRNEIFPSSGRAEVVDEEGMRKEEVVE